MAEYEIEFLFPKRNAEGRGFEEKILTSQLLVAESDDAAIKSANEIVGRVKGATLTSVKKRLL